MRLEVSGLELMLYDLGVGVPRVRSWGRKVSGLGAMFSSQLLAQNEAECIESAP